MPRKKTAAIELLPPSSEALAPQSPTATIETMLERLVRERVDAALAQRIGPDPATERQRSMFERHKAALYYERFGCQICHKKKTPHAGAKLCYSCISRENARDRHLRRDFDKEHPNNASRQLERITARVRTAERLLGTSH